MGAALLVCLACCDELNFCTVLPALKLVYDDARSFQWQALLLLIVSCFVLCSVPVCLLHWHAVTDLHWQAGCMFHALLDSQLYVCLFACFVHVCVKPSHPAICWFAHQSRIYLSLHQALLFP